MLTCPLWTWTQFSARCTHPGHFLIQTRTAHGFAAFPLESQRVTLSSFPRILLSCHCTVVFAVSAIITPTAYTFFSLRSLSALLSQSLVTVCSPGSSHLVGLIPRTRVAQAQHEAWNIVSFPKVSTSPRAMSYVTSLMSGTPSPGTCTSSIPVI